jgi:hypothetical protein
MELLTVHVGSEAASGLTWRDQRRLALTPTPALPGLRARWWRAGRRRVTGRYLCDGGAALRRLRAQLGDIDPAVAPLLRGRPMTTTVRAIATDGLGAVFDRPVFVLCAPRTGSTMLHELLLRSRALWSIPGGAQNIIDGIPPLELQRRGFDSQALDDRDADEWTATTLRAAMLAESHSPTGRGYLDLPADERPSRIRLIETMPEHALRVDFLDQVFPDARYIFLHRDLRQNVSSIVDAWHRDGFVSIPDLPGWPRGEWSFLLPPGWRRYRDVPATTLAAFQWGEANRAILLALEARPTERWTTVSYADLVASPEAEVARLCAFAGVDADAALDTVSERGVPLSSSTVTPPSPIKWRSNAAFDPAAVRGLQPLAGRIRSLDIATSPPVLRESHPTDTRFSIFVDQLDPLPVPQGAVVAPSLRPQLGSAVPHGLPLHKVGHRERFVPDHPLLWVNDEGFDVWRPLWLRPHQAWLGRYLTPGHPPPSPLTGQLLGQCYAAGILVHPDALERRRSECHATAEHGAAALERDRYCHLPGLLDPVFTTGVAAYYRAMLDSGSWPLGDGQVRRRHGWHNERLARFLHDQLADVASRVARRPLKPSYSYTSAYRGGASLGAHMDREQCDYTMSLMVDESSPVGADPWALWFHAPAGRRSVSMSVSDAVLFRGCELPHWRTEASGNHQQINLLFHFVPAEWVGVLD